MSDTRLNSPTYRQSERAIPLGITSGSTPAMFHEAATPLGETTIENLVVAKIVDIAAREIDGVHDLTPSRNGTGAMLDGIASGAASPNTSDDQHSQKVAVVVGERATAIDIGMIITYGVSIPQVADAVRRNVIARVAAMTGLNVKQVNIDVSDLYFPQMPEQVQP